MCFIESQVMPDEMRARAKRDQMDYVMASADQEDSGSAGATIPRRLYEELAVEMRAGDVSGQKEALRDGREEAILEAAAPALSEAVQAWRTQRDPQNPGAGDDRVLAVMGEYMDLWHGQSSLGIKVKPLLCDALEQCELSESELRLRARNDVARSLGTITAEDGAVTRQSKTKKKRGRGKRGARTVPAPPPAPRMPELDPTSRRWCLVAALLIAAAIFGVYWNTLGNEFLTFDDRKYIYENQLVTGDGGLGAIWGDLFNDKPRLHYYPLTFSTFWIEHHFVGIEPPDVDPATVMGQAAHPLYHVTQMLLHSINASLVLFTLCFLGVRVPTAIFTAAFFALHPVNVASVAWVAERKNLISALFLWTALLLYVLHRRRREGQTGYARNKQIWIYALSVAAFALALTGKAAALVLAPVIVLTDWLLDRRWSWASVGRAVPYFVLALLMTGITAKREAFIAKSWEPLEFWPRPFIAVSALAHYVEKIFLPVKQALIYPRWEVSLLNPRYWISLVLVAAAAWLIWRYRRGFGDTWLWGLGLFLISVAPVLGLKHFIWMDFAFVSDHYLYYGSPGVILMIGLMLQRWCRPVVEPADPDAVVQPKWKRGRTAVVALLALVALVACGWRVTRQNRTWRHNQALWSHTTEISPDAMIARMNLGNHYARHEQHEESLEQYLEWVRIRPDFSRGWRSCARAAWRLDRHDEVPGYYERAVQAAEAKNPNAYSIRREYADYLGSRGLLREALAQYEAVLTRSPPPDEAAQVRQDMADVQRMLDQRYAEDPPVSVVD